MHTAGGTAMLTASWSRNRFGCTEGLDLHSDGSCAAVMSQQLRQLNGEGWGELRGGQPRRAMQTIFDINNWWVGYEPELVRWMINATERSSGVGFVEYWTTQGYVDAPFYSMHLLAAQRLLRYRMRPMRRAINLLDAIRRAFPTAFRDCCRCDRLRVTGGRDGTRRSSLPRALGAEALRRIERGYGSLEAYERWQRAGQLRPCTELFDLLSPCFALHATPREIARFLVDKLGVFGLLGKPLAGLRTANLVSVGSRQLLRSTGPTLLHHRQHDPPYAARGLRGGAAALVGRQQRVVGRGKAGCAAGRLGTQSSAGSGCGGKAAHHVDEFSVNRNKVESRQR